MDACGTRQAAFQHGSHITDYLFRSLHDVIPREPENDPTVGCGEPISPSIVRHGGLLHVP
jgi:hypothetical protein